ncbi:hypothetical protein T10_12969 [Trichinella papuae]|uniref:Uncharacterized protein n=1 Tax=Trichinella papuae TaxID=268474 RepID=A0A0V1LXP8_9BILA|nr:hypothetical protein T10_12969 [Trichinella papuae]
MPNVALKHQRSKTIISDEYTWENVLGVQYLNLYFISTYVSHGLRISRIWEFFLYLK